MAEKLTSGTGVDPFDIVHEAIVVFESPGPAEIKKLFHEERRRQNKIDPLTDRNMDATIGDGVNRKGRKSITKICIGCREPLAKSAFYQYPNGYILPRCRECMGKYLNSFKEKRNATSRGYRQKNLEKIRETSRNWARAYRKNNPEEYKKKCVAYRSKNKARIYANDKKSRQNNIEKTRAREKRARDKRKDKISLYNREYRLRKKKN